MITSPVAAVDVEVEQKPLDLTVGHYVKVFQPTSVLRFVTSVMAGNREAIMTGGFLFVCGNEARASDVSLCPDAAGMFLFYFIF